MGFTSKPVRLHRAEDLAEFPELRRGLAVAEAFGELSLLETE